ncbi:MAG: LysR family transcriptional regulator [Betaproteobacteria bacterium]|nr:LysR family transcriptional regulator [Betaproteobacteria bacterium]
MRNATLRQLRVFACAARHLSLTRAAEELHLSPPAVSIQVKQLESHAGAALFERLGRRIRLTPEGEEVLLHAREILDHIRGAEEAIAELDSLARGLLDVAVINAGDHFFPWIVAAFRQQRPGIRVRLTVQNRHELLARLAAREIDLAVMSDPPVEPGHVCTPFAPHPHVIAAAPAHPMAGKRRVPLARIAAEPLLAREPGSATRLAMDQAFAQAGIVPRIEMEIASNETIKQAAAAGLGVGFLSAHALRQELALRSLVILDVEGFPVMRQWFVVRRKDRRLPAIAQAFERFVLEQGEAIIGRDAVRPTRGRKAR